MLVATAFAGATLAGAATTTFGVLLDTDNNINSGCTISTVDGSFAGVESVLNTTVVADSSGYRVTGITLQTCTGSGLSAPVTLDSAAYPVARGFGANGTSAVETYIPIAYLPRSGLKMRLGLTTTGGGGIAGADAVLSSNGAAILFDAPPPLIVPTLTTFALGLTALLLAVAVWYARRRGWHGMQLVVVAVFAISLSGQIIAAIVRDGLVADWTGVTALATDPLGDAPAGTDVSALYATYEGANLFFRIDTALNAPPVANAQTVVAVAGVATPVTLTGSDYEGATLTYTVVTPPAHGTLTGTAPNLTYTATATYGGPDTLVFKVNDGALDSVNATVTLDVKLPPTITSVNNATFIPGQANSFNFAATAVPAATFALNPCAPALPASITVTNNGNNTATLAGNPTVAQGGTYVCTLTASNGFGANATQTFTLNLGLPPSFTSATSTTFTTGTAGSFTVTTTATPATTGIVQAGTLPAGVTFVYNGPGTPLTGTLSGTPAAGTGGTYPITFTAANGIPPNTVQNFVLTVNQAPAITSANNTTCTVGVLCTFTVTTTGFPAPAIAAGGAALPSAMTFVDNGNGTGTLSGTPAVGTVNTYGLTFTATSAAGATPPQTFTLTVNKANTTTTITNAATLALTPTVVGQPYAVDVAVAPAGSGTPTGAITVSDGAATCTITLPATSCNLVSTTVGAPKAITASYAGDASFNASAAAAGTTHTVNKANTTTTISNAAALGTATVVGQPYAVNWTVTVNAPGAVGAALTGNVTVSDGVATCTAAIAAGTCNLVSTSAGAKSLVATYAGDANYNTSASTPATAHTVNPAATTTTITNAVALGTATVVGQAYPVTWTVTVNAPGTLGVAMTGNVTVSDGAATCSAAASAGTCNLTSTTAGAKSLTATYAGDTNYLTSASAPATAHTVNPAATTTTITNAAALATGTVIGQAYPVTWSVTVNAPGAVGAAITGNVTVSDGAATCTAAVAAGTCNLTSASSGTKSITATYAGDANYNPSPASTAVSHPVSPPSTTTTITNAAALGTATVVGQAYPVTWTVTVNAPGTLGAPMTGNVTVSDGVATCVALVSAGACNLTSTSAGAKSLTATYAGDANYLGSASTPATAHTVNAAATTTTITNTAALATATVVGQTYPVNWSVAVNAPGAVGVALTGNVTVSDGVSTCVAAVAAGACNLASTSAGTKSITATYAGDANYLTSASAATSHAVNAASTTTTITNVAALTTPTVVGQPYAVNWTVAVTAPGALGVALTGNVTVSDGTATCSAAATAGTCNLTSTSAGAKSIVATYAGDTNYLGSASAAVSHLVNIPSTTTTITNAAALSTPSLINVAYPVNWSVTVNAPGTLGASMTGSVTVSDGTSTCAAVVSAGTCNLTSTTSGVKSLVATYAGDVSYAGSASSPGTPHTVNQPPGAIAGSNTIAGTRGIAITPSNYTSSGFPAPTFSISALPPGLALSTGGALSGTPTASLPAAGTITATNGVAPDATLGVTFNITCPAVTVNPATANLGTNLLNSPYSQTFTGSAAPNNTPTYGYTVTAGTVPTGTTLSAGGVLSGNTTASGTFNFTVTATDQYACAGSRTYTLNVCPVITVAPAGSALPQPTFTNAYSTPITASGGAGGYTYAVTGGTLPTGLSIASGTGVISGTVSAAATSPYNFTVTATDSNGCPGSTTYTGTINNPPAITNDSFDAVGNTLLVVHPTTPGSGAHLYHANAGVLANDNNGDGGAPGAGITVTAASCPNAVTGGTVTVAPGGTLSYLPKLNYAGSDVCSYTVSDGIGTNTGTITFNVTTPHWYVDNSLGSGGDGRSTAPFNTLAAAATAAGAGHTIHVRTGTGTNSGQNAGITLLANQRLLGEGVALTAVGTFNGVVNPQLLASSVTRPSIGNGAGNAVTLASTNTVAGFTVAATNGSAISGNNFGTATLHTMDLSCTGSGGAAIALNNGTIATGTGITIAATSCTRGLDLNTVAGTLTTTGGTLSGSTSEGVLITGGSATLNIANNIQNSGGTNFSISGGTGNITHTGTITDTSGGMVSISGSTAGTKSFQGSITNNTAGTGISLTNNSGTTMSFSGAISLVTGANAAFAATGGGTVSVTNASNILTTTTGTALNVTGTTIGATGLLFRSLTKGPGGGNGIVLDNTGALAGLTVTGDGANTAVGGNGSGGTIGGTTGVDGGTAGIGVFLRDTASVVLRRMNVTGTHDNYAIRGTRVNGFTLEYATVSGAHGTNYNAAPNNAGEGSIYFGDTANNGVTGNVVFTNNLISGGNWRNLSIINTTAATTNLTIKGNTFGANLNNGQGDQSVAVEARGSGTVINSVVGGPLAGEGNTFTSARSDHANFTGQTGSTMDVQFRNNTLTNNHPGNNIGGGNLNLSSQGIMTYNVDGNTMRDANGSAITLFKASAGTSHSGRFTNNTIGAAATLNSGSASGNGIYVSAGGTGTISATISNNVIHQIAGNGHIYADNTGGSYTANFTIEGNTLDTPGAGWFAGIAVTNGSPTSTDTVNVCAKIGGATAAQRNILNFPGNPNPGVIVGASGAAAGHAFNLPGYAGGANLTNVQNFIQGNNTGTFTTQAYTDTPVTASAFTGTGSTCPTP